nr:protein tesmin/TSO1-like CXC 3 [Populus alba]
MPEVIEIKRVLKFDEQTSCLKPDLRVTVNADAIQCDNGKLKTESEKIYLRKVFRSRLVDFYRDHPQYVAVKFFMEQDFHAESFKEFLREDSPVFNYINNLSPIELVKSIHTVQAFNLPSFASPLSVFTSPQLSSQRDTRSFTRRDRFSEPSKPELLQSKDENSTSEGNSEAAKSTGLSVEQSECFIPGNSGKGVITKPPSEHLELAIDERKALKYGCSSSGGNMIMVPLNAITEPEMAGNLNERYQSYESERDLHKIGQTRQNEDEPGCDWVALISDVADILTLEPSFDEESAEEPKMVDPGTISFISNVLQVPQDNNNDSETSNCVGSFQHCDMGDLGIQPKEFGEQNEVDQTPSVLPSTLLDKPLVTDVSATVDVKGKNCQSISKQQHKIRRRCLVFEMGAHKKKLAFESNSSSTSSQLDHNDAYKEKHASSRRTEKGKTLSALSGRGIGLHLNALTAASNGKAVKIETRASVKQEISEPPSPALNMTSVQDPAIKSIALTTVQTNFVPFDNKNKIMENAPHASMVVNEEFGISSPNMKRQKLENQGASCKRCNCKRSKCLKLYCECFAAGLYCIEPCSCLDCFNNPGHEGTVLETRGQIESRNPLAFAPKVIRNLDSASEFRETNKTPASARHKRGCNCKKSSCLKKYCECFQGGVGCSSYCRCEGCKNTFGCKSGVEEDDLKWEESKIHEDASDLNLLDIIEKGEDHPDLMPPSQNSRSPVHLQIPISAQLQGSSL